MLVQTHCKQLVCDSHGTHQGLPPQLTRGLGGTAEAQKEELWDEVTRRVGDKCPTVGGLTLSSGAPDTTWGCGSNKVRCFKCKNLLNFNCWKLIQKKNLTM
jgi:hypothetical protein